VECPDAEVLAALLGGEASDRRMEIADHAISCDSCRAVIDLMFEGERPVVRGDRIGRYVIEERLGAGGMGVVHAAIDTELDRRVAVKLLRPDGELGSQGRERLRREARTLARLSHPNVVTVFDIGTHGDHQFVAMELVDGGSLRTWLARGPRTVNEIIDRLHEAGAGLAAAHAASVVHRDVKPDNILVGTDGRARITDFGLARSGVALGTHSDITSAMTHAVVGTPAYMAPEQLAGRSADTRSDQWSFCATLYEAVAGVRPFPSRDLEARTDAIVHGKLAEPLAGRRVPGWLRRIVVRGLRANPDERWPSVKAVVDALARGRGRKRRALLAAGGIAAVAAVGIAIAVGGRTSEVLVDRTYITERDPRPDCNCPFAACEAGTCIGQCTGLFARGAMVPGINTDGQQDLLLGASPDGNWVLFATGRRCAVDRLMLARRHGLTFVPVDLTDKLGARLGRQKHLETTANLAADGRSIITLTPDRKRFVRVKLAGDDILDIDHDEFAQIGPVLGEPQQLAHPVISADELTFYYAIRDFGLSEPSPLFGSYVSVRSTASQPFPPGKKLLGRVRQFNAITGVTTDNLTAFLDREYSTRVLVRATTSEPFANQSEGSLASELPGWRIIPLAGCRQLLTTHAPGGCVSEDIMYLDATPPQ
jgi:hypothetical protein